MEKKEKEKKKKKNSKAMEIVMKQFVDFVQVKGPYKDISEGLWGDEKREEALKRINSMKPIEGDIKK